VANSIIAQSSPARLRGQFPGIRYGGLRDRGRQKFRHEAAINELELTTGHVDAIAVLESRVLLRRIELAFSKLKPKTREIFLAHRLDGLSYAEIAQRTGLSVSGVENR
jgi:RNA polymerase sigma-70 factor (ECF subfamily)